MVNSGVVRCFELAFKVKTMNRTTYRTSSLMALPIFRVKTLCDTCHENRIRNAIEAKINREQKLEEILEGEKSGE